MAETNETKLYMDKYLPKERLEPYNDDIGKISDIKKPDINITNFKRDYNVTMTNEIPEEMQNIAQDIKNYKNSPEFEKRFNNAKEFILRDKELGNYEYLKEQNLSISPYKPKEDDKYYIFISSSMPKSVIKNYFSQLDGNNRVVFVMRGFIGGIKYAMPTFNWITELLTKVDQERYSVNINIDPELAKECDIKKVPAITTRDCKTVIYGAVKPSWAFEKLINN
jgi:hypothetical protein